ncbi:MAG: MoxR family ATPase [Candidatus Riflebacteria bacterium]|nr:MoxR family ATPase [Candidatus Riflebacteria bacterium]
MSTVVLGAEHVAEKLRRLKASIEKIIIGKPDVIDLTIGALLARGHLLIADVPGVGETTLAHALARSIAGVFQRVQFTNDMLPSDILGVSVYDARAGEFVFKAGPIFANIVLADEINRTPPKTQSCLLEAMNDGQVTVDNRTHPLPSPFLVLATQNPVEFTGTFPLPESQLDRFLMRIRIGYPALADERRILTGRNPAEIVDELVPVLSTQDVVALQRAVERVRVSDPVADYVLALTGRTRSDDRFLIGISPRGSLALLRSAQALALLRGAEFVTPDEVKHLVVPVFGHRVVLASNLSARGGGVQLAEGLLREMVEQVPVPL